MCVCGVVGNRVHVFVIITSTSVITVLSLSLSLSLSVSLSLSPPPYREVAVRCMVDAAHFVDNYSDFELILEIVSAMASDHGKISLY